MALVAAVGFCVVWWDVHSVSIGVLATWLLRGGAAVAAGCFARSRLDVSWPVAVPAGLLYVFHPLPGGALEVPTAAAAAMVFVALGWTSVLGDCHRRLTRVALGTACGALLALDSPGGVLLCAVLAFAVLPRCLSLLVRTKPRRPRVRAALEIAVAIPVAWALGAMARPWLVSGGQMPPPPTSVIASAFVGFVDRGGFTANLVRPLPPDAGVNASAYLGLSLMVLAVLGLWPRSNAAHGATSVQRTTALTLAIGWLALWLVREGPSHHERMLRWFEWVTLQQYIAVDAQHATGAALAAVGLLPALLFLSLATLTTRRGAWTALGTLAAAGLTLAWWTLDSSDLASPIRGLCIPLRASAVPACLLTWGLVMAAAYGWQRAVVRSSTRRGRFAAWLAFGTVVLLDLFLPTNLVERGSPRAAIRHGARPGLMLLEPPHVQSGSPPGRMSLQV